MDAVILPPSGAAPRSFPWWAPLSVGILLVLVGIGLVIWPFVAVTWMLAVLLGAAFISGGLAAIVRRRAGSGSVWGGIALIAIGLLAIVFRSVTANALVSFVAVALILVGAAWLVLSLRMGGGLGIVPAVLLAGAGILALIWPGAALVIGAFAAGFGLLLIGALVIAGALGLRRAFGQASRLS